MKTKKLFKTFALTTVLLTLGVGCTNQVASEKTNTVKVTEKSQKEYDKPQKQTVDLKESLIKT